MNPLSEEQFAQMTSYCQASDFPEANLRRAKLLGIEAEGVRLAPGAIVRLQRSGRISSGCFIGLYCYVNGEVILEEDVILGPHCSVTSNTHLFDPATKAFTKSHHSPIILGRGSWLCAGVTVTSGVIVGKGNLICAHAVVTKDTPDYAIVAGIPAQVIGNIDPMTGVNHWHKKG